jgi:hypothetical protein
MKLFIGMLLLCFVGSSLLRLRALKLNVVLLLGLCVLVTIGYYFFRQI